MVTGVAIPVVVEAAVGARDVVEVIGVVVVVVVVTVSLICVAAPDVPAICVGATAPEPRSWFDPIIWLTAG